MIIMLENMFFIVFLTHRLMPLAVVTSGTLCVPPSVQTISKNRFESLWSLARCAPLLAIKFLSPWSPARTPTRPRHEVQTPPQSSRRRHQTASLCIRRLPPTACCTPPRTASPGGMTWPSSCIRHKAPLQFSGNDEGSLCLHQTWSWPAGSGSAFGAWGAPLPD